MPDLPWWLTVGMALVALGILSALIGRCEQGAFLFLAGLVLNLAALVRFEVLPPAGIVTLLILVALLAILLMAAVAMAAAEDRS